MANNYSTPFLNFLKIRFCYFLVQAKFIVVVKLKLPVDCKTAVFLRWSNALSPVSLFYFTLTRLLDDAAFDQHKIQLFCCLKNVVAIFFCHTQVM